MQKKWLKDVKIWKADAEEAESALKQHMPTNSRILWSAHHPAET